ncbi:MAG TPA: NAD(P)/FAD-dependent oxidoreductase [Chroococcales cyanobacterium]
MRFDVAVIGAGIIGSLIAFELAQCDLKVALIEAGSDVACGATRANSGIVHAGFASKPGSLMATLCLQGNADFERLALILDFPFRRIGSLVLSKEKEEGEKLLFLKKRGEANGVEGLEIWDEERLRLFEPNIEACQALFAPSAGIVSPYEMCFQAVLWARKNGASLFLNSPLREARFEKNGFRLLAGQKEMFASFLVNAAGLFADEVASVAGDDYSIRARKGEYLLLDRSEGDRVSHVLFPLPGETSKGILITPTTAGNLLLGPTAVSASKHDKATTEEGLGEVFEKTRATLPSIEKSKVIASYAGLRAVGGEDFEIAFSKNFPHWINLIGIQSPGLTAAPAIAKKVVEMLKKDGLPCSPRDILYPLKREVRQDRVICRCEEVGKIEILAALQDGATTLDGVKLRTRATMGRCQGGTCRAAIATILSEELGIPLEEVRKNGMGSEILVGPVTKKLS